MALSKAKSENEKQAICTEAAMSAIVEYLRVLLKNNQQRSLVSLRKPEVEGMAVAAISAYVKVRAEQEKFLDDPIPDFLM